MFPDDEPGGDDESGDGSDPAAGIREPDPEASLADPERELPNVPEAPSPGDAPKELLRAFWSTVIVFNVALMALSVGALMIAFDVHRIYGVAVFAVGVLSFVHGYLKYREYDGREWD